MTAISSVVSAPESGLKAFVRRHQLTSYFVLAYALTWVLVLPIMLSQMGLGIIELPEALLFMMLLVSTFSGPMPAAFIVTSVIEGRVGRRALWRRIFQWRVGLGWYLLVLLGYPVIFLAGLTFYSGADSWIALFQNSPLLLTFYLPAALIGIIYPSFGEEPGWRGFALPRLQAQFGPLTGSLILGILHGLWHLPVYFIPGTILEGPFDLTAFAANSGLIVGLTLLWTWLFNRASGSIFFAMFVHGVSNAASGLIPQLVVDPIGDPWFNVKVGVVVAVLVIVFTRGRLGYQSPAETGGR